jgi:hypothetical protein
MYSRYSLLVILILYWLCTMQTLTGILSFHLVNMYLVFWLSWLITFIWQRIWYNKNLPIFWVKKFFPGGIVVHNCNPSTQEAEVGGLQIWARCGLNSETLSLKKKNERKKNPFLNYCHKNSFPFNFDYTFLVFSLWDFFLHMMID